MIIYAEKENSELSSISSRTKKLSDQSSQFPKIYKEFAQRDHLTTSRRDLTRTILDFPADVIADALWLTISPFRFPKGYLEDGSSTTAVARDAWKQNSADCLHFLGCIPLHTEPTGHACSRTGRASPESCEAKALTPIPFEGREAPYYLPNHILGEKSCPSCHKRYLLLPRDENLALHTFSWEELKEASLLIDTLYGAIPIDQHIEKFHWVLNICYAEAGCAIGIGHHSMDAWWAKRSSLKWTDYLIYSICVQYTESCHMVPLAIPGLTCIQYL